MRFLATLDRSPFSLPRFIFIPSYHHYHHGHCIDRSFSKNDQNASRSLCPDQRRIGSLCHSIRLVCSPSLSTDTFPSMEPMLMTSVLKSDRSISDCIKNRQDLPARCQHLITSFTDCKRGMVRPSSPRYPPCDGWKKADG
jgi:hypothetical protein